MSFKSPPANNDEVEGSAGGMGDLIVVESAPDSLNTELLKSKLCVIGCGSVITFLGITRDVDGGEEVIALEFDAWKDHLEPVLFGLAEQAIAKYSVHSVAISHRTGRVGPSENIVCIHVASPHRKEGFEACSWLITELKNQAPLWKKEVKASGETWKAGLG